MTGPAPPIPEPSGPAGAFAVSAVGAWEWDVVNGRLYGDSRFAGLYGLDRLEAAAGLPTTAFFDPIHPDDRMRIRIAVAGIMHGADQFSKDYRLALPDGGVRWVSAQGRPERDAHGRVLRFAGVLTDVTEQKRVEERLHVAQSAGGVGTFEYISGFGTVQVSDQFCRLLGLSQTDSVALRTINAILPPESPPLIGGAETASGELPYGEFQIVRPDTGEVRWIARRGETRQDSPTGGLRYIGVIYDISAFKAVEGKLRALTVNLEARVAEQTRERDRMWNNSRDLLCVVDAAGVLLSVSPSWTATLGYAREALIGRSYQDFLVEEDVGPTRAAFARALAGESLTNFECRHRHRDGGHRWVSWQSSLEEGLFYGYGRDVTEERSRAEALQQTEGQLRQAQKMEAVGQLTGGLAHDFNNMLTAIIGGLHIIRKRVAEGRLDDIDRFMDGAVNSAHRAARLIQRLLAFSRRQTLDPKPVDVGALVGSMAELLVRTLGEQISLKVELPLHVWPAMSDVNQLESAVLNLAINARDAMPEGGVLTLKAENVTIGADYVARHPDAAPGDFVLLSVSDTGLGMSPEVMAKAFDPFFTTKPIGQGTGLGLSMIYGFVQQVGGHARLQSAPGRGTTACLYLPRAVRTAQELEAPAHQAAESAGGAGERVLVVEDEDSVRGLIVEVLRELGYRALQAADAEAALRHIRSDVALDLMITDVGLPGLNGRQLAEMARQHRKGLKVLFVTGYAANAGVRSEFLEAGMDMIAKPFAMDNLGAKIREMIAARTPLA